MTEEEKNQSPPSADDSPKQSESLNTPLTQEPVAISAHLIDVAYYFKQTRFYYTT